MDTLRCSHCKQIKPVTEFNKNRSTKTGYSRNCKVCSRKQDAEYRDRHRDRHNALKRKWAQEHPEYISHMSTKRRLKVVQATPIWADISIILKIISIARQATKITGKPHHVDHEVPITNEHVSGLHVHFNLRVIPGKENLKKGNRYWMNMPDYSEEAKALKKG